MDKNEMLKSLKSLKSKLMATISMLLVSAIVLTNVSYAWLVLSTAPEVTGLSSTSGANGALEIALQSTVANGTGRAEITSGVGDSMALENQVITESNKTWGNVVDISTGYGLEQITLYPSRLNLTDSAVDTNNYLSVPQFGTDGRVTTLRKTEKAFFVDGAFQKDDNNYGVNVHGFLDNTSGTEQQVVSRYRREAVRQEAVNQITGLKASLLKDLTTAVDENGHGLVYMMMTAALLNWGNSRELSDTEKETCENLVDAFNDIASETAGSLRWALLANAVADTVNYDPDNAEQMAALGEIYGSFLSLDLSSTNPEEVTVKSLATANAAAARNAGQSDLAESYEALVRAVTTLERVQRTLNQAQSSVENDNHGDAVLKLFSKDYTYLMCGTKDTPVDFFTGFQANLGTEPRRDTDDMFFVGGEDLAAAGYFPSMASILGDFNVVIKGYVVESENFTVYKEPVDGSFLLTYNTYTTSLYGDIASESVALYGTNEGLLGEVSDSVSQVTAEGTIPLTRTRSDITAYGYSVDLAFRSSEMGNLVLQQEAVSRIAGATNANGDPVEGAQGSGSMVNFEIFGDMTADQIRGLLDSLYVVFMNTNGGAIYAVGKVDTENAQILADVTAPLVLYSVDQTAMNKQEGENKVLVLGDPIKNNVITSLSANRVYYITAVVYLNGDTMTSSDIASYGDLSLIGSVNLQFALNGATLTPMDYDTFYGEDTEADGG